MSVTNRLDIDTRGVLIHGLPKTYDGTIKTDAGRVAALAPFTVVAKIRSTIAATGTLTPVGTSNGTCTAVAKVGAAPVALIPGTYNLECIGEVANGGKWKLEDPNGVLIATGLVMTAGAGVATVFTVGGITFTLTDGSEDFDTGDKFALVVTADGDFVPLDIDGLNGAGAVAGIFAGSEIAAASIVAADVTGQPIIRGGDCILETEKIVLEGSLTMASVLQSGLTVEEELAALGIYLRSVIDATGYENT